MVDERAEEIIELWGQEYSRQAQFRTLWQQTADLMFPRENQIDTIYMSGADKTQKVYDSSAILDSEDMASGLSAAFIPAGQKFFGLTLRNRQLAEIDYIRRYLSIATDIAHDELFASNFMLQLNENLRALVVFGTGNLYSEWNAEYGLLNFRDWDIPFYQILENSKGIVDTVLLRYPLTARQSIQEFGKDKVGKKVLESYEDPKKRSDIFYYIQIVRPRKERNPRLRDNRNMPFESVFVDEEEKTIIDEGGYEEMPFHVARWMKSSSEVFGRGQGTEVLATVKSLQRKVKNFDDYGNKVVNPPLEAVENNVEGEIKIKPGAINWTRERNSIGTFLEQPGAFPIGKDILEDTRSVIHRAFYADVFAPLANLPGDRRTTTEIIQRVKQAMTKLSQPVYRMQTELFTPLITRCVLLLIRNGRIPYPPVELQGQDFGIEYVGELSLALRNQQAKAFMQWAAFVGEMSVVFPDAPDNIDSDDAIRRMGRAWGVNEEDMTTEEQRTAKRQARVARQQMEQIAAATQIAAEGYGKTTKAPEKGSLAEQVIGV